MQLRKLEAAADHVKALWPIPLDQTVQDGRAYPELWEAVRERDLLSDSTKIFAALAIEGFLNFYGVVRLGEAQYQTALGRLGLAEKCKQLLSVCDRVDQSNDSPLLSVVQRTADRRNALVHPKTREYAEWVPYHQRPGSRVPESAREAVEDMETFFREFVVLVPNARHLVPAADQ